MGRKLSEVPKEVMRLSITKELMDRVKETAAEMGVTRTAWIQMTLMNYFKGLDGLTTLSKSLKLAEDEKKKQAKLQD